MTYYLYKSESGSFWIAFDEPEVDGVKGEAYKDSLEAFRAGVRWQKEHEKANKGKS